MAKKTSFVTSLSQPNKAICGRAFLTRPQVAQLLSGSNPPQP